MMLDVMRIDDCVNEINGQEVSNSFKIESLEMKEKYGKNYKKKLNGVLCYIADTSDNNKFNYDGYYKNFERVLNEDSSKIDSYHNNYPKCKTSVLMIFDQSNNYVQAEIIIDAQKGNANNKHITRFIPHHWYADNKFIDCIKQCNSDYVIWFGWYKKLFVNNKEIKMPSVVCIWYFKSVGYWPSKM